MRSRRQAQTSPRRAARATPRRAARGSARGGGARGNAAEQSRLRRETRPQAAAETPWADGLIETLSLQDAMGEDQGLAGDRRQGGLSGFRGNRRRRGGGLFGRRQTPTPAPRPRTVGPTPAPSPRTIEPTPAPSPRTVEPPPTLVARPAQPETTTGTSTLPTGRELIEGWEQTSKGNCVTVAAIKAAQMTFGPQLVNTEDPTLGIFSEVTPLPEGGMHVVMRDGFELTVSDAEFKSAALSSRFRTDKGRDDLLKNANELYAVAAKRAQIEGNDGFGPGEMSYERSLQALEDGEHTARIMEQVGRLGLKDYAHKAPRSELKNHKATLSSGEGHAYFVSEGQRDFYGRVGALGPAGYQSSARSRRRSRNRKAPHSTTGTVLNRHKVAD